MIRTANDDERLTATQAAKLYVFHHGTVAGEWLQRDNDDGAESILAGPNELTERELDAITKQIDRQTARVKRFLRVLDV